MRPGRLTVRNWSADYRASARSWLGELAQDGPHRIDGPDDELFKCQPGVVDRWIDGEAWLHLKVRLRAGLLDVEPREFHAWLQRASRASKRSASIDAVHCFQNVDAGTVGHRDYGLKRPVLVVTRKLVKNKKGVARKVPFGVW